MRYGDRIITGFISVLIYGGMYLLGPTPAGIAPFFDLFVWQYRILLVAAAFLVALGTVGPPNISRFSLFLRFPILFLVSYITDSDSVLPALMVLSFIQEAGFRQSFPWCLGIITSAVIVALITVIPNRLAFGIPLPGWDWDGLLIFFAITVPSAGLSIGLRKVTEQEKKWHATVDRLDLAVSRLAQANLGYQGYAQDIRGVSIADERRRISREIHDLVGYSLTNIRIMLEAASIQFRREPSESLRLIGQSMDEAGICLNQTRLTMRQLHSREIAAVSGFSVIQSLITAFGNVTGIRVKAEYGTSTDRWPYEVEKTVYRLVQEGMINAFRHGMATEITIYFLRDEDLLRVTIRDNGTGSGEVKEGLGITGMRERVEALGGGVLVQPLSDGFEVKAWVPLPHNGGSHGDSNPIG